MPRAGRLLSLFNPLVFDLLFETDAMRCQVNFIDSTGDARFSGFPELLRSLLSAAKKGGTQTT